MPDLIIRREQVRALEEDNLCRWIVNYLGDAYGERARQQGDLAQLIRKAVQEGKRAKFQEASDLRKYAHVVFLVGPGLAENFPWARKILADPNYKHSGARASALEDAAIKHLQQIAGSGSGSQ